MIFKTFSSSDRCSGGLCGPGVRVPNILSLPGIRQLQLLLLKVALLLGVEIHWGVTFTGLQPPPKKGKYFSAPENSHLSRTFWPVKEKESGWESAESLFLIAWPCANYSEPQFEQL